MAVFEQLNDHFADASLLTARDVNGATPIHFAASSGNIRGLRRLLELGADATAKDNSGRSPMAYAALAIREALNYTVSGDPIPIQINPMEIIGPLQDLAIQSQMRLEQGRPDRVTRSVVLSRVLESIRKRRQAEEDGGETSFRTRREEPTEILVLVEIFIFLMRKYPEREPPSYEEDDIYSAD